MSQRIDKSWVVVASIESRAGDHCVDFFRRPDETFGFEHFRRDVEDAGRWTPVGYFSEQPYGSAEAALAAAEEAVAWLAPRLREAPALRRLGPRRSG